MTTPAAATTPTSTWMRDLNSGLVTGSPADETRPYVELAYGTLTFDMFAGRRTRVLQLVTIAVPPRLRRRGLATRIVTYLEERAAYEGVRFAVGPIMEDADDGTAHMETLCRKRGYRTAVPWSLYRPHNRDPHGRPPCLLPETDFAPPLAVAAGVIGSSAVEVEGGERE